MPPSIRYLTTLTIILLLIPTLNHAEVTVIAEDNSGEKNIVLYFLNGIIVYNSLINETLILETPTNISLKEGFEQKVLHLVQYNLIFNETIQAYTFNATSGYVGFFLSRIEIRSKPMEQMYESMVRGLFTPASTLMQGSIEVPEEVSGYLKNLHLKVVEVVKPEYEMWFKGMYGYDIKSVGPLGIAATAAYFIQFVFIDYDPSGVPRAIDEVIDSRRGDCDDMSRILVELLNAYGIPAVVCVGYVNIDNFNFTMPIENVTYKYVNCGPHAFVMAYIPNEGWLSLDLLAFTFLKRPFVFEGYTRETTIEEELVQEHLRLHQSLNATQVMALLREEEALELLGKPLTLEAVMKYFQGLVGIESVTPLNMLNESGTKNVSKGEGVRVVTLVEYVVGIAIASLALVVLLISSTKRGGQRTVKFPPIP